MTTAVTNRSNSDVVDFTIEQRGSPHTEVFLEEPLLDGTLDYVVGCSALAIPMSQEPMITFNDATRTMLEIRMRNEGQDITTVPNITVPPAYSPVFQFQPDFKIYSPADFLVWITNWALLFTQRVHALGLPAGCPDNYAAGSDELLDLLGVGITPGGVIELKGTGIFWRNFFLDSYPYGRSLLGIELDTVTMTRVNGIWGKDILHLHGENNIILGSPGTVAKVNYLFDQSLFRYLDERLYVSLELTEIPLPDHIMVRDGKQTMIHEIASFPIESNVSCRIESSGGFLTGETEIRTNVYMNRTHFTSRDKPCYSWYPLTASYFIQNARLQIFITRRVFKGDPLNKWVITRENIKISDDQIWAASLKFVSMH